MTPPTFPAAFHFSVSFTGAGPSVADAAFQEVSGLQSDFDAETSLEDEENHFVHKLPKRVKNSNLELKRGLTAANGELVKWCKFCLEQDLAAPIELKHLMINLLNEKGNSVLSWSITNAYPVKWSVGDFDAMKDELAVETISLVCNRIKRNM